jgi:3-deoxy-manno-octulosonate cytidylyltransferase (CMP-KDO synthetase)
LEFVVVIPARYASTRLPGKPLLELAGKPLVVHVAERAAESGAREVWIATDDERIVNAAREHGCAVVMTQIGHATGTDRIAEVASARGWPDERIVVNVQGDEPLMPPDLIRRVAETLAQREQAGMSTACVAIGDAHEAFDPNAVKVVLDREGYALYFSRATIPWARDAFSSNRAKVPPGLPIYRHLGIYAYRCGLLKRFPTLPQPEIERFEALEQLRALWHGLRIAVTIATEAPEPGVDTAEDLEKLRRRLADAGAPTRSAQDV